MNGLQGKGPRTIAFRQGSFIKPGQILHVRNTP